MNTQQIEVTDGVAKDTVATPRPTKPARRAKGGKAKGRSASAKQRATKPKSGKTKGKRAAPAKRSGTKQEQLIAMLRRKAGASIDEVVKAFGWQPHTVRGAFAGALKKRLGLTIVSEPDERRGRVYRIRD